MAIKRNKRFHIEVATSALSDIMFFLLLFFLIISTLANPNVIKVPLPESKTTTKTNKQHLTLTVTQDKHYFLDKQEVQFSELESMLVSKTNELNDKTVILRIPFDSDVQELVDLLRIGMDNNLKVIIATKGDN
ncbi:MAG: biopolymer transporter ExbD [Flavobacteriia bacterium]|jgi:biopolymer transport protein ExbD|nr:biopolymer transporter ExbD [Flavobacteriia bacterium]NBV67032.1 biopolymer transporter ExbD [Flavobacteriia bacterium]NBV92544.1 biopolymer transporter ExbD [Flavobacteriia bacterium]NBY40325.1 biopolymer transporter ExbD [Flavobacteriia bacterium]